MGELASFSKGSGYSKSDLTDAGTPIILYGRLYTKYETVISKVDTFADAKSGSVYSKGGEVIVPGSGETAEDISIASVVENAGVLLGGDLNIITPPEEIDSAFLAISISNGKPHKDMAKMAQGKSVVHLHNSDLGKIDLPYPSMEEQRKISGTFANLDNLITLHQRKQSCNTLLINVWEQRKFGDVGSVAMCKRIFKEQTSEEGDVPFYKIGTFGGSPDAYISRELFEEYKKAYQYPSKGDILISASGSIGRTVEYTGEDEYFQDSNIVWLKHGDNIDNAFLKVLYSVVEWSCEGSTIKRLYNDNFLKTEFMLPYIEEQTKIGEFFSQIDNLITLHRRAYHYTKRRTYK